MQLKQTSLCQIYSPLNHKNSKWTFERSKNDAYTVKKNIFKENPNVCLHITEAFKKDQKSLLTFYSLEVSMVSGFMEEQNKLCH